MSRKIQSHLTMAMGIVALAYRSSPVAYVSGWKSPVLLIHGDDDRNVPVDQTVDLVQRLAAAGVPYEEIIIPDDTHHFMRRANSVRVDSAVAEFMGRKLRVGEGRQASTSAR